MQKVPLALVKPGMVLAAPIMNEKGIPLISEETELTEALIARLARMNVAFVSLKNAPVEVAVVKKPESVKVKELERRFARLKGDPIMEKVRAAVAAAMTEDDTISPAPGVGV